MDKGKLFSGLAIMLGLIIMGSMLPKAVEKYRSYDRTVNVKGLCEKEVKADRVIWPIVYRVMANDIQSIYDQTDANNAAIMGFLQEGGINPSEISVSVPQISDKFANEYGDNDRAFRYIAKNIITVYTSDVDTVLALMGKQSELLKKGIVTGGANQWENPVEFKYEGLNDIKPQMIEEATENARAAAKKFAKDSGSRLGKIKTANQGTFTIENRDSNTPYIKKVRVVTSVTYYLKN
ncbi:MAG: SIMPL domain-containing protein [Bacteroidales bacterium]|nr:SIMPL domain-containing protein [Bacteroidales bacterium]